MIVAVLVLGPAPPAQAHASLVATDPGEGVVLAEAPDQVRFSFSETVAAVPDGVQVYDATGETVGSTAEVSGSDLDVVLTDEVGDGTLVVVWRVVSRDGHPTSGSLSFSVGAPSATVVEPPVEAGTATEVPWWLSAVRWVGYLGLFLAAGLAAFGVLFLPGGAQTARSRRRVVRTARTAAAVAATAWLVGLPVTALYQLGGGLGSLGDGATWSALPTVEYAVALTVAAGVVAAVALLGTDLPGHARTRATVAACVVATTAPALTGHTRATTPEALAVAADMLHLLAGSTWLGGVVGLALVLPDLAGRGSTGATVLARFSTVAAAVLGALVVTGTVLAWRIVGSWGALVDTAYGRLLLLKIAAAVVVVGLAAWNRYRLLPGLQRAARRRDRREGAGVVTRVVTAEAGVLLVVLLLTGLLVDRSPEAGASVAGGLDTSRPVVRSALLGPIRLQATMSTQATGRNTVTLELLTPGGEPTEGYAAPLAALASDETDLGAVPVVSVAPGVYEADVVLPTPGTWDLEVSLRTTETTTPAATLAFPVSGGEAQLG